MATKIITAFFTDNGIPETGLSPTIDIWELDPNPAINTQIITAGALVEVGGGFYRYDFTTYDFEKDYTFLVDGGSSLPNFERYNPAVNESYTEDTWGASAVGNNDAGSMGEKMNQISADTQQIRIDVTTAISLVTVLLKYEKNRTLIDKTLKTLTVFDDDGTTPLKVFDLKDSAGNPSIIEVCERVPQP